MPWARNLAWRWLYSTTTTKQPAKTWFIASLELKTSFLNPAYPGLLLAEGRCLKMGRSSCFLEAELRDETGKLLATMTSTAVPIRSTEKPRLVETSST